MMHFIQPSSSATRRITPRVALLVAATLAAAGCADSNAPIAAPLASLGKSAALQPTPSGAILPALSPTMPTMSVSTVPSNGDLNPYGVAFVPSGFAGGAGPLQAGDILVSNFNNSTNAQGTGTTIVSISPSGQQSLFFQGKKQLGLTTALGVLRAGFVIVGNVPSLTPKASCTQGAHGPERGVSPGSLLILDATGKIVSTLDDKTLAGPWDLTIRDLGSLAQVFVSDVLSGTVTRIDLAIGANGPRVAAETQIASGYSHRCDPAALVVGPTGLAWNSATDVLYVSSTGDNQIFAVANASTATSDQGKGTAVITGASDQALLHGPLGLALASNGDLISAQGDAVNPDATMPSEIVEFTAQGAAVSHFSIDPAPGSAFGLALTQTGTSFVFAAVDDGLNVLDIWKGTTQ